MSKKRTTATADSANATLGTNESSSSSISKTPKTKGEALGHLARVLKEQIHNARRPLDRPRPQMDLTRIREAVAFVERCYPDNELPDDGQELWASLWQTTRPRSSSSSSSSTDGIADEMYERAKVFLDWVKSESSASAPEAATRKHTTATLRGMTGLTNTPLNEYARAAKVTVPGKGKKNHRYTDREVCMILQEIIKGASDAATRDKCTKSLKKLAGEIIE